MGFLLLGFFCGEGFGGGWFGGGEWGDGGNILYIYFGGGRLAQRVRESVIDTKVLTPQEQIL